MNEFNTYGWHIEITNYYKGTFLLGANLNFNDDHGDEKEKYLMLYLGKFAITIGKFHKYN